jgi:membrane protein implicated in regulation of membrane protease activity
MLTLMYMALAVLGCGYVLVSTLLGHLADFFDTGHAAGGEGAAGAAASGTYGVEAGGHGTASATHVDASVFHFPFFSPLALATLFGSIGAWGLITKYGFRAGDGASLVFSIPLAVATAYGVTYVAWRVVTGSRGSSQIRLADLVGAPGEVLTPIPAGGVGEIAAIVGSQRYTGPAREIQGREVPRGAFVRVVRIVGATLVVAASDGKGGDPQ